MIMTKTQNNLKQRLARVAWTLWSRLLLKEILRWGFYGCLVSVVFITLTKFSLYWQGLLQQQPGLFYGLPFGVGCLLGCLVGLVKKPSLSQSALFLDNILKLDNKLVTALECLSQPKQSQLSLALINDSFHQLERVRLSSAYRYFDLNYVLRFIVVILIIGVLTLIPVVKSPELMARTRASALLAEESARLRNTVDNINQRPDLDAAARSIVEEMDRIADILVREDVDRAMVRQRLDKLSARTKRQLAQLRSAEQMIEEVSVILEQNSSPARTESILKNQDLRKQLWRELTDKIARGEVKVTALNQLKSTLRKIKRQAAGLPEAGPALADAIQVLETGEGNLEGSLEKFFETIARKQEDILERISSRLKTTRQETDHLSLTDLDSLPTVVVPDRLETDFSVVPRIGQEKIEYPIHQTDRGNIFFKVSGPVDSARESLVEQVIKSRETALTRRDWPVEYNEVIEQYFGK